MTNEKMSALKNAAVAYEKAKNNKIGLQAAKTRLENMLLTNYRELMMAAEEVTALYGDLSAKDAEIESLKREIEERGSGKKQSRSKAKEGNDE